MNLRDVMRLSPVIPVLTVTRLEHAAPLAQALVRGGIRVLEVTLRTACALDAITEMREMAPGADEQGAQAKLSRGEVVHALSVVRSDASVEKLIKGLLGRTFIAPEEATPPYVVIGDDRLSDDEFAIRTWSFVPSNVTALLVVSDPSRLAAPRVGAFR